MAARSRGAGLEDVVAAIEALAPPALAEPWDNVGLLAAPSRRRAVHRVLLAIDLTPPVLDEAIAGRAELIVAYHPPIFAPVARLASSSVVLRAIEARIAIHSPHTALDAAPGGVNDWLAEGLGSGLRRAIAFPNARLALGSAADRTTLVGQGRFLVLDAPASLDSLERRVAQHLGLDRLRVAAHPRHAGPRGEPIVHVALCAGAGGDVVMGRGADLIVTGELSHHRILAAQAEGSSVILSEHSHTERGYLPRFAASLARAVPGVDFTPSKADRDPLAWR
jgi:dinuclear metal center YbgI/SA1388 family protein